MNLALPGHDVHVTQNNTAHEFLYLRLKKMVANLYLLEYMERRNTGEYNATKKMWIFYKTMERRAKNLIIPYFHTKKSVYGTVVIKNNFSDLSVEGI